MDSRSVARRSFAVAAVLLLAVPGRASADYQAYPVAWPRAAGGTLVAVPTADATVDVYHLRAAPYGTGYDVPFPSVPEQVITAPAGQPIVLQAPPPPADPSADEDHFYVLLSTATLTVSMADDERSQPGSPDRIFFMPATSGTFRGRTFYSQVNGGDAAETVRVLNLGSATATVSHFAWNGTAWEPRGSLSVAPTEVGIIDPAPGTGLAGMPYKVESTEDALALVGYIVDNATAPAVDLASGLAVGTNLWGLGRAYFLRAVEPLSYTVWAAPATGGVETMVGQGTLAADQGIGAVLGSQDLYIRIALQGGLGWAITGTGTVLSTTGLDGYFLPAQCQNGTLVGRRFFTNSAARVIAVMPNVGTTVEIFDEGTGGLLESYTSTDPWVFHHRYNDGRVRIEFTHGPGSVLLVGQITGGTCNGVEPDKCGILEGGYSVPGLSMFRCGGNQVSLTGCKLPDELPCALPPDGGVDAPLAADAAAPVDASAAPDAAVVADAAVPADAVAAVDAPDAPDAPDAAELADAGVDAPGASDGAQPGVDGAAAADAQVRGDALGGHTTPRPLDQGGCSCRAASSAAPPPGVGLLAAVGLLALRRRARRR